jgi:signal transduction histidine kinase
MNQTKIDDLESKLALTTQALRTSEVRATAGGLALEGMHDIRNPLDALGNLMYLILERPDDAERVRIYAEQAQEQIGNAIEIANSTLGFAQASNRPKPTNLVLLAEAALRIHQRTIREKQVRLLKDLPEDVIARVHSGEMLQVISNLLSNALDAVPKDGVLFLRLRKRQGEAHFVIADNGHGIPVKHVNEIFQPFFTTKGDRGTGLGLALSKKIVEHHRGTIRVRSSVRPGKSGTIFKICLPA